MPTIPFQNGICGCKSLNSEANQWSAGKHEHFAVFLFVFFSSTAYFQYIVICQLRLMKCITSSFHIFGLLIIKTGQYNEELPY